MHQPDAPSPPPHPWQRIRGQVALPGPVAAWVLGAHLYATLLPLVLVLAVQDHWDYVARRADHPGLFSLAVALLCTGSAFEVAQNTADRWYLTPDTGSALAPAFCDLLFFTAVTAGQAVLALALGGSQPWVQWVAGLAVVAAPLLYLAGRATFLPLAVTGVLGTGLAWQAFGDPLVFLGLGMPAVTLYFFGLLLRTGAQSLHGCTTLAAASGLWFTILPLVNGAAGRATPWPLVLALAVAVALVLVLLRRPLGRLQPTAQPAPN